MANRIGAFGYMECSAKTKDGVREVFEMATRAALQARRGKKNSKCLLLWMLCNGLDSCTGAPRVCEGHTSVYSVIHPPHIRQKLWERDPSDKKSFVFVCFSFCSYIFSHGDVYQYLKELGTFLTLYLKLWYPSSLPTCQMLSRYTVGWLERCDPVSCQSISQPFLICWAFSASWNRADVLFLYVNHFKVFFRLGKDWDFRTNVQNGRFSAKRAWGGGLICIHTCTYNVCIATHNQDWKMYL